MDNEVIGRGWPFPLRVEDGRLRLLGGDAKIRQSLWLILATSPGGRAMRPTFGCGLRELVFEATAAALRGVVDQRVREAVTRFEKRIDLLDVRVTSEPDRRNCLLIELDYRVRASNAFYSLVYPFFLQEGAGAEPGQRPLRPLLAG